MADDPTDQIVADHAALDDKPDAPTQPVAPTDLTQSDEARQAREAIGRQRADARERKAPTQEPGWADEPTPKTTGVEENPYQRFVKGPQDNGPDNLERTRLNAINSYYRSTVAGALGLKAMASIYNEEDPPDMSPEMKKARQGVRDEYENVAMSLMRYDMMPSWSGLPQLGAAVAGSVAGGSISPEAFAGWAAKGATWTARTMWSALQQGLISGATDPIVQHLNISAGVQNEYEFGQTAGAFAFGTALGGGFHAAGEGAGHLLGQRELRRQLLDLSDVDPSVGSAERALWRFDPRNGYQERVPEFPYQRFTGEEPPPPGGGGAREAPDYGFADTVAGEQERGGEKVTPDEARQTGFEQEVGTGLRRVMDEYGLPPEKYDEISRHYDRQEGESVETATQRAVDDWVTEQESGERATIEGDPELQRDLQEAAPPAAKDEPPKGWEPAPDQLEEAKRLSRGWAPRAAEGAPPQSLVNFVRKNGGLRMGTPEAGDLLAQDVGRQPGLLRKEGKQADQMAQMAIDAGFDLGPLGEIGSGVNVDRFMAMLAEDAGKRVRHYPQGVDTDKHFELQAYNDDTINHLRNVLGVNPKGMDPRRIAWLLSMESEHGRQGRNLSEEGRGVSAGGEAQPGEGGGAAQPREGEPGGGSGGGREAPAAAPRDERVEGPALSPEKRKNLEKSLDVARGFESDAVNRLREAREAEDEKAVAKWTGEIERYGKMVEDIERQLAPPRKVEMTEQGEQPVLLDAEKASPEQMAARERAAQKEEAEARMRGRQRSGRPQESAEDTALFGGERQSESDLLGLRVERENAPLAGEERRNPDQGVPAEPLSPEQEVRLRSLHRLALDLADAVGVPLRQGRLTLKKAAGQFDRRSGVARTKEEADFEVVKHEVAHAIEQKVGKELTDLTEAYGSELSLLDYDQTDAGRRVNEGFAEWMRVRMTNPRAAQQLAPNFYNAFNAFMVQKRPDLLNLIGDIAQAHRAWLEAPSIDVGTAVVRNTIPDPLGIRELQEDMKRDGWAPTASHVMGKFYEKIQDQYTHYIDKFADLERAVHDLAGIKFGQTGEVQHILASQDASILIRSAHLVGNTAMIQSRFGMVPFRGVTPEGPGLAQVMNTALGNPSLMGHWDNVGIEHFDQYVTARMSEYLWRMYDEGKIPNPPSPIKPGDAREIIAHWENAHPGFKEASNMLQDFVQRMRKKAFDAGLMGADTFAKLSEFEFYVPMRRIFDEGEGRGRAAGSPDNASLGSTPRKRRGSERDIDSPLRNIMRNLFTLEQDIRRNEINGALLRLSEGVPGEGGAYAERLPATEARKYSAPLEDMIKNKAKEMGVDPDEARSMVDTLLNGEEGPLTGSYWRYETAAARGEPIQFVWENGKPIPMRVMSKQAGERYGLHEIMSAMPPPVLDLWTNFMQLGATTLRAGITNSPVFILTNYLKDQFQTALSQPGYIPILGGLKGIKQELAQDKVAVMRAYFGGIMGGSLVGEVQHKFNADIRDLAKQGYAVRHLTSVHGLIEAMQVTEAGTRNSIFERYYKAKLKEGLSEYDAAWEASHQANDIMDFSRHGDRMSVIRKIVPFLNANIQGQDRYTFRTLIEPFFKQAMGQNVTVRDREESTRGLYSWAMAGAGGLSLGAVWAAVNWEKDAYRDASPEVKGTHIVVPYGSGKDVFVMPKPFELGIGFTAGEYLYGMLAKKDPRMAEQMTAAIYQAMSLPNPVENIPGITPALEMSANKSFYTGRPIVPEQVQNKAHPDLEYNDRTSPLARELGKIMGWSPMKVDYALGAYFGTNGRDLMSLSGMVDRDTPTAALDDTVFARRFIKNSERISGRVRQFWDLMGSKNGKYHDEAAAYRKLVTEVVQRGQDPKQANELLKNMNDSEKAYVTLHEGAKRDGKPAFSADDRRMHPLTRAYDAVHVLSGLATEIQSNTFTTYGSKEKLPLTPDNRRDLIDEIRTMAGAEMRNAFVVVKEKGYADRQTFPLETYMDKIRQISPQTADEIASRYATAKVYSFDAVKESWPRMQQELAAAGTDARLSSMTGRIKGAGYEFHGTRAKRPGPVRQPIEGSPVPAP